jgi:hypothetical protein
MAAPRIFTPRTGHLLRASPPPLPGARTPWHRERARESYPLAKFYHGFFLKLGMASYRGLKRVKDKRGRDERRPFELFRFRRARLTRLGGVAVRKCSSFTQFPEAPPLKVLRASKDVRCKPRLVLQKLHTIPEIGVLSASV